jgi:hypothetical protein
MNLDYLNLNSLRNFPIIDGASCASDDGLFVIPTTLIVDMSLCATDGSTPSLYISRITVNSTNLVIEISSYSSSSVVGTFQTSLPFTENTDLQLTPSTNFPLATGLITLGSSDDLARLPYGDFTFKYANTRLLSRIATVGPIGINWISFSDTKGNKSTVTGHVEIQGNSNIQFREATGIIYVDAGEGLGLNKICENVLQPITSINGITPDSSGNFTLIADQCIEIDAAQYGVVISNPCGAPCLGNLALSDLTTRANKLESSILDINNFTKNLQAVITQANTLISTPCPC